ncbi:hypothetical protein HBH50_097770 [Parastagonospora nodorum]|nr:hypothetical protein HBH50_097770 [Parastagonospora nodorum]
MINDSIVSGITRLSKDDPTLRPPKLPNTLPDRYGNSLDETPSTYSGLTNLKQCLEDWIGTFNLDLVVWLSAGDVGSVDADTNKTAVELA